MSLPAALETQEIVLANLAGLAEKARDLTEAARSANTIRAYEADLRTFCTWCRQRGRTCLPASPKTLSWYLADVAGTLKRSTISRRVAAIAVAHRTAGYKSPTKHAVVQAALRGLRRTYGVAQRQATALDVADLRAMVSKLGDRVLDVRDRALLLAGFAGALRRSEIVALDVADVTFERRGAVVTLRRSKTNQDGAVEQVAIPYGNDETTCPVLALEAWIALASDGPLFRNIDRHGNMGSRLSSHAVASIVKRHAESAGLDATTFSGHSLRSGFATAAARAGKSEAAIMRQTRHKSVTVARKYIRQGTKWDDHAAVGIGL